MTIKETSAGAVVFRRTGDSRKYLLLNYPSGHWDFVKGKMEAGESEHQTAVREAKEETGIADLRFIDGYKEDMKYEFIFEGQTVCKTVVYFLAETATEKITISNEHIGFVWLSFDDAMKKATYESARRVLSAAEKTLESGL